jgi:mono/diheme cytochrome c family protein
MIARHRIRSSLAWLGLAALALSGCQQKMADQPSYKPLQPDYFFPDGRSARPLVTGTVARGHLHLDREFATGVVKTIAPNESDAGDQQPIANTSDSRIYVKEFPIPMSESVLRHGQNRYAIYCTVCHDPLGTGRGQIVERGFTAPPTFHSERLRDMPPGRMFAVVTEGYGSMPSYADQIPPEDRWAIVAYVRALQLSQHFPQEELTPAMRERFLQAESPP